jgi:hypothetical protein
VWGLRSIVWTDPDGRQRNLLLGQKIDFDIAVAGSARPAVGASLTPRAIWRVVGLQYWGVYNPVPLYQHPYHLGWEISFIPGSFYVVAAYFPFHMLLYDSSPVMACYSSFSFDISLILACTRKHTIENLFFQPLEALVQAKCL